VALLAVAAGASTIVEQLDWRIKWRVRPGLGFGRMQTAERTSAGFEAMAMIRKGQVRPIGDDMQAQPAFGLSTVYICD
jgi:transposase, IS6 family